MPHAPATTAHKLPLLCIVHAAGQAGPVAVLPAAGDLAEATEAGAGEYEAPFDADKQQALTV